MSTPPTTLSWQQHGTTRQGSLHASYVGRYGPAWQPHTVPLLAAAPLARGQAKSQGVYETVNHSDVGAGIPAHAPVTNRSANVQRRDALSSRSLPKDRRRLTREHCAANPGMIPCRVDYAARTNRYGMPYQLVMERMATVLNRTKGTHTKRRMALFLGFGQSLLFFVFLSLPLSLSLFFTSALGASCNRPFP